MKRTLGPVSSIIVMYGSQAAICLTWWLSLAPSTSRNQPESRTSTKKLMTPGNDIDRSTVSNHVRPRWDRGDFPCRGMAVEKVVCKIHEERDGITSSEADRARTRWLSTLTCLQTKSLQYTIRGSPQEVELFTMEHSYFSLDPCMHATSNGLFACNSLIEEPLDHWLPQ